MMVDLEELKRLLAKATPGPWHAEPKRLMIGAREGPVMSYLTGEKTLVEGMLVTLGSERIADHWLVATLRNVAPALIEELEALRELEESTKVTMVMRLRNQYDEQVKRAEQAEAKLTECQNELVAASNFIHHHCDD